MDVETARWISIHGPTERVFLDYRSLVGLMYEQRKDTQCATLLHRLIDVETMLTMAGILLLLDEMNSLIKQAQ